MNDRIAFTFIEKGAYAPREGLPYIKRENIAAIIKYENNFLFLAWNEVDYDYSLVTGGIEKAENRIDAVKREVIEETGYYDIKRITKIDCINISRFFVEHKGQNREAFYYPYLVELNSLSRKEVPVSEKKEHTCFWADEKELEQLQMFENHRKMLKKALEYEKSNI